MIMIRSNHIEFVFFLILVPIANNSIIEVWVHGEKIGSQWQFDDGTPIPDFCPISMTNGTSEVHLRARGTTSFTCADFHNGGPFHYSCEYNRVLSFNN